jgi:hypothetical protein
MEKGERRKAVRAPQMQATAVGHFGPFGALMWAPHKQRSERDAQGQGRWRDGKGVEAQKGTAYGASTGHFVSACVDAASVDVRPVVPSWPFLIHAFLRLVPDQT